MSFRVEIRNWEEARPSAAPLRYSVFMEEKYALPGIELDDLDAQCVHALAIDEAGTTIATGRLQPDGAIGRMAVLKDWRRRGVGEAIMQALVEEARRRGYPEVSLTAPLQAAEFYRELGFEADGKVQKEAGLLQQRMRKSLA